MVHIALLAWLVIANMGCRSMEDKRTFQYLNQSGFGKLTTGDANTENYLEVGDVVAIKDSLHPDLMLPSQEVGIDGTIYLPEVGQMRVRGMTRATLKTQLDEVYAPYYDKTDIQVKIESATATGSGKKYFVVGEVDKPGAQAFKGNFTVFEAVLDAEPKRETANLGRIQLIRGDPVDPLIITFNYHDFIDYGDTTYNLIVHENDIIYVPPTLIGSIGNFVEKLVYPIKVIVQPLQSILFFFAIQNRSNNRVF